MVTKHQYLHKYPVDPESEKLIVGTIHPQDHNKFIVPFFYGNKISIWKILSEALPADLPDPEDLNMILAFLKKYKIAVSDTIIQCSRINLTALDQDLIPEVLNHKIIDDIKNSRIREILFTSGFGKNNAFKIFYVDILGARITPAIRKNREVMLDKRIFGREIKLTVLYSPSGSSNVPLSTSRIYLKNKSKYANSPRPVYDFKIDYYRDKFRG